MVGAALAFIACSDLLFPSSWPASVPAIHALPSSKEDVDGRDKRGHDAGEIA
jgi:hypothetical protein